MADDLRPASSDELTAALAHALAFDGRKHWHRADEIMSGIVAGELVDALDAAGFVIMRKLAGGWINDLEIRQADCRPSAT